MKKLTEESKIQSIQPYEKIIIDTESSIISLKEKLNNKEIKIKNKKKIFIPEDVKLTQKEIKIEEKYINNIPIKIKENKIEIEN